MNALLTFPKAFLILFTRSLRSPKLVNDFSTAPLFPSPLLPLF